MSRELRHKPRPVPARKPVRRAPSTTDESSDDDEAYAAVDQISDSEEDEPDVEKVEERAIISSVIGDSTPRPSLEDDTFEGFSDYPDILDGDLPLFGQEGVVGGQWNMEEASLDDVGSTTDEDTPRVRRVRFEESDDEIDVAYDDVFPDIFVDKNDLDSSFRRQIDPDDVSEDGSYWEHDDNIEYEQENSDDDTVGSSGYETDEGDTTDEDLPEAAHNIQPRKVLRRRLSNASSSSEESIPVTRERKPRLYSWKHEESHKPFAVINSETKRLILFNYNRQTPRRFSLESPFQPPETPSHRSSIVESSPMISNSGNVMMSAMHDHTFGPGLSEFHNYSGQALGPPEAFYPFTSINADGTIVQDSSSFYDTDDLELDMKPADLEEFFNFDDEAESESGEPEESTNDDLFASSTPVRPTTATSEDQIHPLISHFNAQKGVVGSWRQKQNTHQLLHRNITTEDSLAFSGNQFETIKGVKSGRLQHANTPITPVRRQRPMVEVVDSSPLAALNKKRKFEGAEFSGHKRNKSLF